MEKEKRIKIAQGTDFLPGAHEKWGGAEQATLRLAMLLKGVEDISQFFITLPSRNAINDFNVYQPIPIEEKFSYLGKIFSFLKFQFPYDPLISGQVKRILSLEQPDILHLHNFDTLSFSMITAAESLRIPVIFSLYDLWALCPKRILMNAMGNICTLYHGPWCSSCIGTKSLIHRLGKKYRKDFFFRFLHKVKRFIVLSETVKRNMMSLGYLSEIIEILPLPLLFEEVNIKSNNTEENSLLFAGWVNPHKGLHIIIESLALVKNRIPAIKLYVAETGADVEYRNKILKRIHELNLKDNVIFLGKLSNEKVREYLLNVKGVVVPEQWGIAWPIFLTEAMYYAKPILASRIGDIPSFIRDNENGYLADHHDITQFTEKIIELLVESKKSELMARKAREDILRMTDELKIVEKLLSIYKDVLRKEE